MFLSTLLAASLPIQAQEPSEPTTHTVYISPNYEAAPEIDLQPQCIEPINDSFTALCTYEETTRQHIVRTISETVEAMGAEDNLLLIYVGAGWTDDAGRSYLLPADFAPADLVASSIAVSRDLLWTLRQYSGNGTVTILTDAIHAEDLIWSEAHDGEMVRKGLYTIGPHAPDFADDEVAVLALSATNGEYSNDSTSFSRLVSTALSGSADLNRDDWITYGELEQYLVVGIQEANASQHPDVYGNWVRMRNARLMQHPGSKQTGASGLRKPLLYSGIGMSALGCAAAVTSFAVHNGSLSRLQDGAYDSKESYDQLVRRVHTSRTTYPVGLTACGIGATMTTGALLIPSRRVQASPYPTGITFSW